MRSNLHNSRTTRNSFRPNVVESLRKLNPFANVTIRLPQSTARIISWLLFAAICFVIGGMLEKTKEARMSEVQRMNYHRAELIKIELGINGRQRNQKDS